MTITPEQAAARFEIMDCAQLYCHAVDRRRWELMARVFHEDATYQFFSIKGFWHDFVEAARTLIDPMIQTHHQVSNIMVRFERDDLAYSETYLRAYHVVPVDYPEGTFLSLAGGGSLWIGGRYIDRLERRDGSWRIAHRQGLVDWTRSAVGEDGGLSTFDPDWCGRPGDGDPSGIVVRTPFE